MSRKGSHEEMNGCLKLSHPPTMYRMLMGWYENKKALHTKLELRNYPKGGPGLIQDIN